MISRRFSIILIGSLMGIGCSTATPTDTASRTPQVYVVNDPLRSFAETIGGNLVDVHFPIPEGEDPDFWKPDAETLARFQQADLILLNGATYGKWITNAPLPLTVCVDTSNAFANQFITIEGGVTHSHGAAGEHTHAGTASLTWLDLKQAAMQARAVGSAIRKLVPDQSMIIDERTQKLENELLAMDEQMRQMISQSVRPPLIGSHPVFQYWVRRYGLSLQAVHWEADAVPDAKALAELATIRQKHPAKWMIWEATPNPEAVALLEKQGVRSAVFATSGDRSDGKSFIERMRENMTQLKPVFTP